MVFRSKLWVVSLVIISVFIFGCKDNTAASNAAETVKKSSVEKSNNLNLYLDGYFHVDNEIKLTFKDFEGTDSIVKKIKGMPNNWQRVEFNFPEETIPYTFNLSFLDKRQSQINLDKIVLNRENDRIIIKDSALLVYFQLKNFTHKFEGDKLILNKKENTVVSQLVAKENLTSRVGNRYKNN